MKKCEKNIIGYTAGVYDMFHVGHLNILKSARQNCDYLIVGVNSDEATYKYKKKYPIIPENERMEIIEAIKYVDEVVLADDVVRVNEEGTISVFEKYHFDMVFIGDDHKDMPRWQEVDMHLRQRGSKVWYLPYTKHISSSKLSVVLDKMVLELE